MGSPDYRYISITFYLSDIRYGHGPLSATPAIAAPSNPSLDPKRGAVGTEGRGGPRWTLPAVTDEGRSYPAAVPHEDAVVRMAGCPRDVVEDDAAFEGRLFRIA